MPGGSDSGRSVDLDLTLVAAVAENGVIGADDGMPWHYPADLRHFKETTVGHPVIVGRVTYESIADRIGGPLPDRENVVLTGRALDLPAGAVVARGLAEAVSLAREAAAARGVGEAYVVGGASVYEQFLPRADRMVLTEIPESPDGDTTFPEWDRDEWTAVDRETDGDLTFVTYERR